jgi:hypothetical protein
LHHGIGAGDFLAALKEGDADALGAFEVFEVVSGVGEIFTVECVAICTEVLDGVVGDELADEFYSEGEFSHEM